VKALLLHTNAGGTPKVDNGKWKFMPKCHEGACDTPVRSISGKYDVKAVYIKGHYRWSRHAGDWFTCTTGTKKEKLASVQEVMLKPTKVSLRDGEWVASAFSGSEVITSTKSCGFFGAITDRYAVRGKLIGH
jgi:hypothetical protein